MEDRVEYRLYTYWRSSAAFRVRIALALKGLTYESVPKHLLRDGGEQRKAEYLALNPQGLVPALEHDGSLVVQSLAICEYLEEVRPEPRLLPGPAVERAQVRAMALAIACDVHPLNNLRVLQYLANLFSHKVKKLPRNLCLVLNKLILCALCVFVRVKIQRFLH